MPAARQGHPGAATRRRVLGAALAAGLGLAGARARADAPVPTPQGLVLPRPPAPDLPLTDTQGRSAGLPARLQGKVSALHLMFAGCSSTCPVQGAVFAAVAQQVRNPDVQLLSITVDPLGDSPQALREWLGRFGPQRLWTAHAPRLQDVDALATFLRGAPPRAGTHTSRVFLFDRQARLAFRTAELPGADHLLGLLDQLARA